MRNTLFRFSHARGALALLAGVALVFPNADSRAAIVLKSGQTIAFLGDSITEFGWKSPFGYVRLVVAGLAANNVRVLPLPAGVFGNNSSQMLARLKPDVLDKKPDWVTVSCGVNDVRPGTNAVPLGQFKANITAIVDQCRAAGVKVMLLTATGVGEELDNDNNQRLAAYNACLRELAKEKRCPLADLNALFQAEIRASPKPGRLLTVDGVHMNQLGDQLMAKGILQAFGADDAQMERAEEAWFRMFTNAPARPAASPRKGR